MAHQPVMLEEVMTYLKIKSGGTYIDATLNGGGHAREILRRAGKGSTVVGIERDGELAAKIKNEHIHGLVVENRNYKDMNIAIRRHRIRHIDGVLFDFGLSSWHIDESRRGFSFRRDEVLDMRFSQEENIPGAAHLINSVSEKTLADIFYIYGEERQARRVAHAIVQARKEKRITTTGELVKVIIRVIPRTRAHPATKIFQALRIAVNNELETMKAGLDAAMRIVAPQGRVVALSFHSLEDRIVKESFRSGGTVITKKPITPAQSEVRLNPRSRSAKLRAWENI